MPRRLQPERMVAFVGIVWIAAAGFLLGLTPLPFFAGIIGLFTLLGVLVAWDARRLGQSGWTWGFATLFFGPFAFIPYVWYRAGLQASAGVIRSDRMHKPS